MADGKVVIETDLDSSGIEKGLSKLGSITAKGMKAATVAITGTAAALGGVAAAAIKVGSDFESQMSRVKAISGATGEEFEQLKEQAMIPHFLLVRQQREWRIWQQLVLPHPRL